jgi:hypothetical protein
MMPPKLTTAQFPQTETLFRGRWAPVFLSPILGSPERFVIAVAAVGETGFHIEAANALKRLECLYGRAAETAMFAAEVALDELYAAISAQGTVALTEGALVFSGVNIGEVSDGEARSPKHLACIWMSALSSLYKFQPVEINSEESQVQNEVGLSSDRLPILVLDHVNEIAPSLSHYFHEDIRLHRQRRSSSRVARISIDYNGPKLAANFATLHTGTQAQGVDRIKRKMFDLTVRRDDDAKAALLEPRRHEMIIFTPARNSPLLSGKQVERLDEALGDLTEQSEREGFSFIALHDVPDIGQRLLRTERPPTITSLH